MGGQLVLMGTHGPRTSCAGGQLVLGPRVRGNNLKGRTSHPMTSGHEEKKESASEISCITDHCFLLYTRYHPILQHRHTFRTQINSSLVWPSTITSLFRVTLANFRWVGRGEKILSFFFLTFRNTNLKLRIKGGIQKNARQQQRKLTWALAELLNTLWSPWLCAYALY